MSGITGRFAVTGDISPDVAWLLSLGAKCAAGADTALGCGRYRLRHWLWLREWKANVSGLYWRAASDCRLIKIELAITGEAIWQRRGVCKLRSHDLAFQRCRRAPDPPPRVVNNQTFRTQQSRLDGSPRRSGGNSRYYLDPPLPGRWQGR